MELTLSRTEKKGMFGTTYRLDLDLSFSAEEKALISKHKLQDMKLFDASRYSDEPWFLTPTSFFNGPTYRDFKKLEVLVACETDLKTNGRDLHQRLKSLGGTDLSGGTQTINFDD